MPRIYLILIVYFVPPLILGGTRAISPDLELNAHSKMFNSYRFKF